MATFNNGESAASVRAKINAAIEKVDGTSPITSVNIDSGAIDGVTLGTNSAVTEAQVDNLNLNGNTISTTDTNGDLVLSPNGTGEVDISKVDIDGGTIDGTVIGGSTPAAISGTTGSFSGNLAVDTNTLFVDATNNRVGIGTSSPIGKLEINTTASSFTDLILRSSGSGIGELRFGDTAANNAGFVKYEHSLDSMTLATASTDRMRITSAGIVDILGGTVELNGNSLNGIQVTIADDAVAALTFTNRQFGMLSVVEGADNDATPDAGAYFLGYVDFGSSAVAQSSITGGGTAVDTVNTLNGTTGVDGEFTVGVAGTSGTLYLENRRGGARVFNVTLM